MTEREDAKRRKGETRLYETDRKTPVVVKPTRQFLRDLNLLMSTYRIDASEVVRESVNAQAEYVRGRINARLSESKEN